MYRPIWITYEISFSTYFFGAWEVEKCAIWWPAYSTISSKTPLQQNIVCEELQGWVRLRSHSKTWVSYPSSKVRHVETIFLPYKIVSHHFYFLLKYISKNFYFYYCIIFYLSHSIQNFCTGKIVYLYVILSCTLRTFSQVWRHIFQDREIRTVLAYAGIFSRKQIYQKLLLLPHSTIWMHQDNWIWFLLKPHHRRFRYTCMCTLVCIVLMGYINCRQGRLLARRLREDDNHLPYFYHS